MSPDSVGDCSSLVSVSLFAYAGVMYATAVVEGKVVRFNANPVADHTEIFDGCAGNDLTSEAAWLARVARAYAGHRG